MTKPTRIETGRLVIRPFTLDDLEQLAAIFAHPEVMRFIGDGPISEREPQSGSNDGCRWSSGRDSATTR